MAVEWGNWASLGRPPETEISRLFAQRNQDGRLEVFGIGLGGIFNTWQVFPDAGWRDGWLNKGRPSSDVPVKAYLVGRNADGRLEIFAVGDDQALWQKWQVAPNDGWSEWKTLGIPASDTSLTDQFAVGRNQDGRQEVFVVGSDTSVWQLWQTAPNNGWSHWARLGTPPAGIRRSDRVTAGTNLDGRQELFLMGEDDALWHIWQTFPNAGWSGWESLGKPKDAGFPEPKDRDLSNPLVQLNADGHLEVFAPGNGAFCNRWQESPGSRVWRHQGWNAKPRLKDDLPAVGLTWLEAALNFQSRLEVVALGDDGALWHAWQVDQPPFWSPWHSLLSPPVQIRAADRPTIGTNRDGRLEVFVVGQDGAAWHIWQIR